MSRPIIRNMDIPETERTARGVALPAESRVTRFYPRTELADAFSIGLPAGVVGDVEQLARFLLTQQPPWVHALMKVRDAMVAGFGVRTSGQMKAAPVASGQHRVGLFRLYETHPGEVLLGEDDKHLDFRLSVLTRPAQRGSELVVSTVVHCHNLLGRGYIALIAPFHRRVVCAMLERAARTGWPVRTG